MIDINAYLGNWLYRKLPATPSELLCILNEVGIEKAFVSPVEGIFYGEPQIANKMLIDKLDDFAELFPVPVINPTLPNWKESLYECSRCDRVRCIKLHPNYHCYQLSIPSINQLMEKAVNLELTVIIQLRVQDIRSHHPLMQIPDVDVETAINCVRENSSTNIVLGGIKWVEASVHSDKIKELPNLWIDISQIEIVDVLRRLINIYSADKLLLGTHSPFLYAKSAVMKLKEALLSETEREKITRENISKIIKW